MIEWDYSTHPNKKVVAERCDEIVASLADDELGLYGVIVDTRRIHRVLFEEVTLIGAEYFAGNYRGANYPNLSNYNVQIGDYTGSDCSLVAFNMDNYHKRLKNDLLRLRLEPAIQMLDNRQKFVLISKFIAANFVDFLAIHPYGNGNGHISRLLVWAIFNLKKISCKFWLISNRNINPPDFMVGMYRSGDPNYIIRSFMALIASENGTLDLA